MIVYFDSSSIVKWFFDEPHMDLARNIRDKSAGAVTSLLSFPEVMSAIRRAMAERRCSKSDMELVREEFLLVWPNLVWVQIRENLMREAGELVYRYTITIEPNDELLIIKKKWLKFQLDKIKEACSEKIANILIAVMDRDEAIIALIKRSGFETLSKLKGEVQKKEEKAAHKEGFYDEIIKKLQEYIERYKINNITIIQK